MASETRQRRKMITLGLGPSLDAARVRQENPAFCGISADAQRRGWQRWHNPIPDGSQAEPSQPNSRTCPPSPILSLARRVCWLLIGWILFPQLCLLASNVGPRSLDAETPQATMISTQFKWTITSIELILISAPSGTF